MSASVPPQSRRRWRMFVLLLAVMLAGSGLAVWYIQRRIDESGERVTLVWPGQATAAAVGGHVPQIDISADLAATGVRADGTQIAASEEVMLFVDRQRVSLHVWLTAGNEPLDTTQLGYLLFSAGGDEIGHGVVQPPVRIEAGKTVATEIVHARVAEAARIEIRKLP